MSLFIYLFIHPIHRKNGISILWRVTSTKYADDFLDIVILHNAEPEIEITGFSINFSINFLLTKAGFLVVTLLLKVIK